MPGPSIAELHLEAAEDSVAALQRFYAATLGLPPTGPGLAFSVGGARLSWRAAAAGRRPFYHVALLVPGRRFDAALAWIAERAELLQFRGETVVPFPHWDAHALYFHDPAGSIVELIAHRGIDGDGPAEGPFAARELLAISEAGIVVADKRATFAALHAHAGIGMLPGSGEEPSLDDPAGLAFLGRRAHALILAPPGRGWMPTGRPAEPHPMRIVLSGSGATGTAALPGDVVVDARQE